MKSTISVFAIIAVAAIGIGVSGVSASTMMVAGVPAMSSSNNIMGHLEYTLYDADGNVKTYGQTDNVTTTVGDRCIAEAVFERGSGDAGGASCANANFDVIAISNATVTLDDNLDITDESTGSNSAGVLATVQGVVTVDNISEGAGNVGAVITNSAHPFTFTDSVNATNTLTNAYLVDAQCAQDSSALGTLCDGALFSGQILAGQTLSSLAISDGDTLAITWTVSIGQTTT